MERCRLSGSAVGALVEAGFNVTESRHALSISPGDISSALDILAARRNKRQANRRQQSDPRRSKVAAPVKQWSQEESELQREPESTQPVPIPLVTTEPEPEPEAIQPEPSPILNLQQRGNLSAHALRQEILAAESTLAALKMDVDTAQHDKELRQEHLRHEHLLPPPPSHELHRQTGGRTVPILPDEPAAGSTAAVTRHAAVFEDRHQRAPLIALSENVLAKPSEAEETPVRLLVPNNRANTAPKTNAKANAPKSSWWMRRSSCDRWPSLTRGGERGVSVCGDQHDQPEEPQPTSPRVSDDGDAFSPESSAALKRHRDAVARLRKGSSGTALSRPVGELTSEFGLQPPLPSL